MSNKYYIRAIEQDWPQVIALAKLLEVVIETEDGIVVGDGWVYIGRIDRPTGETFIDERTGQVTDIKEPVRDEHGNLYLHANVIMDDSLRARAEAKAAEHHEIAAALQEIPRYFLTDENGNTREPNSPAVVPA